MVRVPACVSFFAVVVLPLPLAPRAEVSRVPAPGGAENAVVKLDGAYAARNRGQRWSTRFDGRGFTTTPDSGSWTWGLELVSYGAGSHVREISGDATVEVEGERIAYEWDSELTEWYVNDARGLEHGYTLARRPSEEEGAVRLTLATRGGLAPRLDADGRGASFVGEDGGARVRYTGLAVAGADGRAVPARFERDEDRLVVNIDDRGARYPLTVDPVAQQAYVKASNTEQFDQFGWAVAVSGHTVVVGAQHEDSASGGVNGNQGDNSKGSAGAAYVFTRGAGGWSQQAYLKAPNPDFGDQFGFAVAISGDTIVVGANTKAMSSGVAYVFVRSGTTWTQQAILTASNADANDLFGSSVAIAGDTIVVGAYLEDSGATGVNGNQLDNGVNATGAAYVYVRSGTSWTQQAYLKASNTGQDDTFGYDVAISGDTIVVSAEQEDSNSTGVNGEQTNNNAGQAGSAYVFTRSGTTWSQQAYLKASNTGSFDFFGHSVSISGNTIAVTAPLEDSNSTGVNGAQNDQLLDSGAAYVFVRNGTTWSQQAFLKASTTAGLGDWFGESIAVSGNIVAVGQMLEDSDATGVNGDPLNSNAVNSGAVFVFRRIGTTWSQYAYLKSWNTGLEDRLGRSVDVSGDWLVAGADFEDSNATGIDGDFFNDNAKDSGAAYVYDLDSNPGTSMYGAGTPGCSGPHTIDVNNAPIIGSPGFAITCDNAPPSSLGLGIVTDSPDLNGSDPFGLGAILHVDFFAATEVLSFDFVSDPIGFGLTVNTGIPSAPALIGKNYYAMALWVWTSCSLPPFNLSTSPGLAMTILAP